MDSSMYDYLINTTLDAYVASDATGNIVDVNAVASEMYGYSRDELLSLRMSDIELQYGFEEIQKVTARIMMSGYDRFESRHCHKDGRVIEVEVSVSFVPERQRFLAFHRDITERKRVEEQLKISEENYRQFAGLTSDYVHKCSRVGSAPFRIDWMGGAVDSICGYTQEELFEKGCWLPHVHPDDQQKVSAYLFSLVPGDLKQIEFRLVTKQGAVRLVSEKIRCMAGRRDDELMIFGAVTDITEQRRAEEQLRETLELFGLFMRYTPVYTFIKRIEGDVSRVIQLSDNFIDMVGKPAEELRGRTMEEIFAPDFARKITEDDINVVNANKVIQLDEELNGRTYTTIKFPIIRAGRDSLIAGFTIDITERKQAETKLLSREQALASSERFLKTIIDSEPECIKMLDIDGNLLMMNPAGLEMIQADSFEQVQGKCVCPLITGPYRDAFIALTRQVFQGTPGTLEFETIGLKGRHVWLDTHAVPFRDEHGEIVALLGITRNVTEQKNAEKEKQALQQQIQQTQKLESLGILAGGIAHDFNNILMAIVGNADLAKMRLSPESPALDNILKIELSAARATELAKQMLAYSGRGHFVIQNIDLNKLIKEMVGMLEVSISKKAMIHYSLSDQLPSVEVDATQIRQILMNLVINASEAIGDKEGIITVSTGSLPCDRRYLDDIWLMDKLEAGLYVCLEVKDTGCGMSRDVIDKLFDPFYTTKFTGRGLGMAAVLGIVRGHKGAINVQSEEGKGSVFTILLPAAVRSDEMPVEKEKAPDKHGEGTVLLVDDEEIVRDIGSEMLKELGYTVVTAEDGLDALNVIKGRDDIDFVILDLTMPKMDGTQCFRALRAIKPNARVIMSSGYNEEDITKVLANEGLAGFIQKPYTMSLLKAALSKM